MHIRVATFVTAALLTASGVMGITTPAGAAPAPRLPDFELFCSGSPPTTDVVGWGSDTLWVTSGPLSGHYVVVSYAHYLAPGLLVAPPTSVAGLPLADAKTFGHKTGVGGDALDCTFVSRWDLPGTADDFTVTGPIVVAPTP